MTNRREFLKSSAWMGMVAMAAGCSSNPLKMFGTTGAPMQGFALNPMKKVRVACVGVGARGGMDFIMDLRWSYCLQNGLPLDTDVYDLAAWSATSRPTGTPGRKASPEPLAAG